jgi:hypothetical protein
MSNKDRFNETAAALDLHHHPLKLEPESDNPVHNFVSNEILCGIYATTRHNATVPPPVVPQQNYASLL